jgi:hypothetical protein
MRNLATANNYDASPPKGIQRIRSLPDPGLGVLWKSIILNGSLKTQLLSQSVLNFTLRGKIDRSVIPLHGAILLVGPPGTGKTSLARGLAHRTAESFPGGSFRLLEIEPHALTSSAMGKTQRAVSDLFAQSIAEAATAGPTIVLLDEVETLAADRTKLSLEACRHSSRHRRGLGPTRHARRAAPEPAVPRHQQFPAGRRQRFRLALRPGGTCAAARP